MTLPSGVERHDFGGETSSPHRDSRCTASGRTVTAAVGPPPLDARCDASHGMDTGLGGGETVLYLGAAAGTTVSHVADLGGPTYAVEFAPRPVRELLDAAESRRNLRPLLKDDAKLRVRPRRRTGRRGRTGRGDPRAGAGRRPQPTVPADDGRLLAAVKARSEDVTADPDAVFDACVRNSAPSTNCSRRRDWTRITRTISVSSLGPEGLTRDLVSRESRQDGIRSCGLRRLPRCF